VPQTWVNGSTLGGKIASLPLMTRSLILGHEAYRAVVGTQPVGMPPPDDIFAPGRKPAVLVALRTAAETRSASAPTCAMPTVLPSLSSAQTRQEKPDGHKHADHDEGEQPTEPAMGENHIHLLYLSA
jgi:hypothetical protein